MSEERVDFQTLPCGCTIECVIRDGERVMKYVPCHLDCEFYVYVQEEGARQGKPIEEVEAP